MAEWLEGHMAAISSLNSTLCLSGWNMAKLETGRALRWKVETAGWEGRGLVHGEPAPPRL
jgi:hypothetical protein